MATHHWKSSGYNEAFTRFLQISDFKNTKYLIISEFVFGINKRITFAALTDIRNLRRANRGSTLCMLP
jgi:hypothetical protein